jgi:hypothetical protein
LEHSSALKKEAIFLLETFLFIAGFLLGAPFDPEDGSDIFLRNVFFMPVSWSTLQP